MSRSSIKRNEFVFYMLFEMAIIFLIIPLYSVIGIIQSIVFVSLTIAIHHRYNLLGRCFKETIKSGYVISFALAVLLFYCFRLYPYYSIYEEQGGIVVKIIWAALVMISFSLILYPLINMIMIHTFEVKAFSKSRIMNSVSVFVPFFFMLFVFLPCETYTVNKSEYSFPLQSFIVYEFINVILFSALAVLLVSLLKKTLFCVITSFFAGIDLCMYIQYLFFNRKLILIDGESMNWDEYILFSVLTLLLFIILTLCFIVVRFRFSKIYDVLLSRIPVFILGVQLLSTFSMLVTGGNDLYAVQTCYMDAEEQYTVSSKKNVILFILDATDNSYFDELLTEKPEDFSEFNDFTLYTNTCSVFDNTGPSVTQMLTGMEFKVELSASEWFYEAWNGEKATTFFNKFHDNNFVVNGYYSVYNDIKYGLGKFDNCYIADEYNISTNISIDTEAILDNFYTLSVYRVLPFILKKYIDYEHINFDNCVSSINDAIYFNDEYEKNLQLNLSENDKNYFIVEHLNGTHAPCTEYIDETEHLLKIIGEYISQLKRYGVYDEASIIITADHGKHNDSDLSFASTPVLMIKKSGDSNNKMKISDAPVYHEDMQATLLECSGLYDSTSDRVLFGRSVFEINPDEQRTRIWYDRDYKYYREYTFTGNTDTLTEIVAAGKTSAIYEMTDYKS